MKTLTTNLIKLRYSALFLFALSLIAVSCGDDDSDMAPPTADIEITDFDPESPSDLKYYQTASNDRVIIAFDYDVTYPDGVRVFIKPESSTAESGSIFYSPSPIYEGSGSDEAFISVGSDDPSILVDQISIRITSADQSETISETFIDVNYTFSE